ncbi:MAG: adenylate cyclase [Rhodobacteraceae bacterium]|nr:adenylate cyclase [Paracoccaceae bacterium]
MNDSVAMDRSKAGAVLERVLSSDTFAANTRLQSFLKYVVSEDLEGRGDAIRAKTIGMDVYGYSADEIDTRESVVRVDAGRVRRKLEAYYAEEGADDPVRIELPKGTYRPRLVVQGSEPETEDAPDPRRTYFWAVGLWVLGAIIIVALIARVGVQNAANDADLSERESTIRTAIFEASPVRLEAVNLAHDARDLMFPAVNPARLDLSERAFDAVVALDPQYYAGYAGRAQTLAMQGMFAPAEARPELIARANRDAERALELAPGEAWAQSALAWVRFAQRNFEDAVAASGRAVTIAPDDPHIMEFDALISLYAGDFARVIAEGERLIAVLPDASGFVFRNAVGSARFHMGDFEGSVREFEDAIAAGAPVGAVSVAYLMAGFAQLGEAQRAGELASRYNENWPDARVDLLFSSLFKDARYGQDLGDAMRLAGWTE